MKGEKSVPYRTQPNFFMFSSLAKYQLFYPVHSHITLIILVRQEPKLHDLHLPSP